MTAEPSPRPRARIAEARRNREKLLAAATRAFTASSDRVALESIARDAGVGIATLYRHFPSREALVEAVYRDQAKRLGADADELLAAHPPAEALRLWMTRFADWSVTKHGMVNTLRATSAAPDLDGMRADLAGVVGRFLEAGVSAGDLRGDVDAADVAASLAGILSVAGDPALRDQAGRLFDLLLAGLRAPGAG